MFFLLSAEFSGFVGVESLLSDQSSCSKTCSHDACGTLSLSDTSDVLCQANLIRSEPLRSKVFCRWNRTNSRPNCVTKGIRRSREGALPVRDVPDHCFRRSALKKGYSGESVQDDPQTVNRQPDTTGRQIRINESN